MKTKRILVAVVVAGGLGAMSVASAATINTVVLSGNDCAGVFSNPNGFNTCTIPTQYDPTRSPVIAKFDFRGTSVSETTINPLFPSVTGGEFTISFNPNTTSSGTWSYNPGTNDPGVTAWVAKGGNNFQLFYTTPKEAVTFGTWSTPGGEGLSHITFYDSASTNGGGGPNQVEVPAPGALAILGFALLGLGAIRRPGAGA
jgi:hypothetical protein